MSSKDQGFYLLNCVVEVFSLVFFFFFGSTFIIFICKRWVYYRLLHHDQHWDSCLIIFYNVILYFLFTIFSPLFSCILLDWVLSFHLLYFPFLCKLIILFLFFLWLPLSFSKCKFNQYICLLYQSKVKRKATTFKLSSYEEDWFTTGLFTKMRGVMGFILERERTWVKQQWKGHYF